MKKRQVTFEAAMTITAAAAADKCPRFEIVAYTGGPLRQPWSDTPIVVDLAGMEIPDTIPILSKHSTFLGGIGHTTEIANDGKKLTMTGDVSRDTEEAREFVASAKKGYPWKASIGATVNEMKQVREGTVQVNGQTFTAPVNVAFKSALYETSICELPADAGTSVGVTATQGDPDTMKKKVKLSNGTEIEVAADANAEAIRLAVQAALGTDATETVILAAIETVQVALKPAAAPEPQHVQATGTPGQPVVIDFTRERQLRAAEITRCETIQATAKGHPAIAAKAIADGWTVEKTELEVLRASRPQAPNVVIPGTPNGDSRVLAAALCQTLALPSVEKQFSDKELQAAHTAYRGRIGLQQLIVEAARRNGYQGSPFLRDEGDMRNALKAAFSSDGLDSVFVNVMNLFLMTAFNSVEDTWREIARINPTVNDFREYQTYANISDLIFEDLAANGKIKHGVLKDKEYANQLSTRAKMISITRADIINDAIGVLRDMTSKMGRGAALKLNVDFWTELLEDSAFFTADNKNLLTGAGNVLGHPGLKAALKLFRDQTGPDGYPLGVDPAILLTPPSLEITSAELMTSTMVNTGGAATDRQVPNKNIWAGKFKQTTSVYMGAGKLKTAAGVALGSDTAYYLLAKPEDLPVIEIGFLRGAVAPTIQQVQPDADDLGIVMRGWWDYGVRKQVTQGGVKVTGVA